MWWCFLKKKRKRIQPDDFHHNEIQGDEEEESILWLNDYWIASNNTESVATQKPVKDNNKTLSVFNICNFVLYTCITCSVFVLIERKFEYNFDA